jgi:hypothetical protein
VALSLQLGRDAVGRVEQILHGRFVGLHRITH